MSEAPPDPAAVDVKVVQLDSVDVPSDIQVSPAASPEQIAAIWVAYDELWPEPAPLPEAQPVGNWRFSGRWWRGIGPRNPPPPTKSWL